MTKVDSDPICSVVLDADENVSSKQIRHYAYMVYPDSCDVDKLIEQLNLNADSRRMYLLSPLHDKDVNDDGTPKKPHYHLFCMHANTTTTTVSSARNFGRIMDLVGLEIVHNKRGYARYLCHLDNPDKASYNVNDVKEFACNYKSIIGNSDDKYANIRDIIMFVKDNNIIFYCDLVDYCMTNNDEWFKSLIGGATFQIEKYIKERRNKIYFEDELATKMQIVREYG